MKNYILSDGRPMSVSPEREEEFLKQLEKQGLTATLESDELGKSQGAGQPQINQQQNTESKSEDGSSEPQESKISKINQEIKTDLSLDSNSLKSIDNREIFNFKANDKSFWGHNKEDAIEQMQEIFGVGDNAIFQYKDAGGDKVEITHKNSRQSTVVDFNIGLDEYKKQTQLSPKEKIARAALTAPGTPGSKAVGVGLVVSDKIKDLKIPLEEKEKIYNEAIEQNSDKLFNFLNDNLKGWERDAIKTNQQILIDDYKSDAPKVTEQEKEDIKKKQYETDLTGNVLLNEEGKPIIKKDFFKPIVEKKRVSYGTFKDQIYTGNPSVVDIEKQPHKEELSIAKQSLIKSGQEDPSKEQIEDVARNLVVQKDIDELLDDKVSKYMNSKEVEGRGGKMNKVKIAAQLSSNKDAKELIKLDAIKENKFKEIERSNELKRLKDFRKIVDSKDSKINIREGEEAVELKNGKVIPKSMYDQYVQDVALVESKYDLLNNWLEENNGKIEDLEDSAYKRDLIRKNYDDFEKFVYNIGSGFDRILVGSGYGLTKGLGAIVGIDSDAVDNVKLDYDKAAQMYHDEYQKDIKFENAFDSSFNFGKFVAQEFGQQLPIFATLAVPYVGIPALGVSSAGDNWSEMVREDKETGSHTSTFKKFVTSAAYGTAEVIFDRWITRANMYRGFKGLTGAKKQLIDEAGEGIKYYLKNNTLKHLVQTPVSEMASESFTTITQNALTGRPLTENLGHSAFSGGMFGGIFGGAPFMKGVFLNKLSTDKTRRTFQDNNKRVTELEQELLWAKEGGASENTIKTIENQIMELKGVNEGILEFEAEKANSLGKNAWKRFFYHFTESENLKLQAREINNDKNLDSDAKKKLLNDLTIKYNAHLNVLEKLRDPKVFNSRFELFSISEEKEDKKRKEEVFQDAYNNLINGDSNSKGRNVVLDPSEAQIKEEARIIYNTQEIYKDYKNKTKTGFGKRFKNWNTVDKAIFEIEKMENVSEETKAELIEELKQGAHGANIPTIDPNTGKKTGKFVKFQVVENMAKDDRLTTRTHELGHDVLSEIISANPEAFRGIAEQILEHTKVTNPALYIKLSDMSMGLPIDEVITNFMELVVENDLRSNKNQGLGPLMAWMFGDAAKRATNSDVEFNFQGETDAVNFITQLARKIKNGEVDIKSLKESRVAKEAKKRVEGEDYTPDSKFSKPVDAKPYVDELTFFEKTGKTYTKEEWGYYEKDADGNFILKNKKKIWNEGKGGAKRAIEEIKKKRKILEGEGYLDKLIAAKYKVKPVPPSWVDDVIGSRFFINHVRSFNPEVNNSLYGWINPQIRNKAGSVFNKNEQGKLPRGVKTLELDAVTTEGRTREVADVDTSMETFTDNISYFQEEVQPNDKESKAEQSKLRKEIGIGNLGKGEIFKKVRTALATSKAVDEKGFIRDYEKNLANLLEPTIARILNDPAKLKKFRVGILEAIPIKTLVQMQKFLPEKIFIKDHGRQTNLTNLSKFVEKGLLPASILNDTAESKKRRAAGVRVYERLNTTTKQFENYIDAPTIDTKTGKRSGTRGNNRAKVISEVSKAIGKDATPETLTPEFIEDYLNIKDLKGKITPEKVIEKISEQIDRSPGLKFSKKAVLEIQDIIQADPDFKRKDRDHIDKVLGIHIKEKVFKHGTQPEIDNYFRDLEEIILGNIPANLFGVNPASVFSMIKKSRRVLPNKGVGEIIVDGKKTTINDYFDKKRAILRDRIKNGEVKFGKPFSGKGGDYVYGKTYADMFGKTEAEILKSEKNGTAKRINEMHQSMHEQLWQRINNSIQQDPMNAKIWGSYLSLVGQDVNHPHRMGAEYLGHSTKPKGVKTKKGVKQYEWEHAMPATAAYLYLLNASLGGYDFSTAYELVMKNYKLIALDSAQDLKLKNAGRATGMGKGWDLLTNSWLDRYFHPDVAKVRKGINPKSIIGLDGKTFAETFNINSDGKPAIIKYSKSQANNTFNAIEAFNNQARLIRKQNRAIQADLEKRGYTFVEKSKYSKKGQTPAEMIKIIEEDLKARGYTIVDMDNKGMSTFDFDETLIIDGENFVVATDPKTGEKINIKSGDWPIRGPELAEQGYEFNFDDFVNVRGGKDGPLLQKMKNQIKKYGPENVFILTARPQEAATAIDGWLKSKGINIPFKNITGLADSKGQAKADWMLEKFAEGYNDMYFVDDALPNVKAVKNVLEQLDIKSKVVQAKIKFSKTAPLEFNEILEQSKGIAAGKRFSVAEARKRGVSVNSFNFFIPPSAEDFKGLLYSFLGKGRQGDAHAKFFKENLLDPFAKASREWNSYKQAMSNDYKALKKQFPKVGKMLNKKVKGTSFTNDAAIRVYLWDKAGFEIPGISKALQDKLIKQVNDNPELKQFAEGLSVISRVQEGYIKPNEHWVVESIASDLANTVSKIGRKDFFAEWIENKNIIFSPENLNKIEAIYGTGFRNELEKILYRMETGQNRTTGKDAQVNKFLDWINGSVGAVMFFNMRSATLQTISMINFINASDNNVFKAAAAFANQPQFWKDFSYIFNSDMLKQRRAGLQIDVSASELTKAFNDGRSRPQAIIAYLLEKGFTPTQVADSFAIAMGGAPFYRNRVKKYLKDGMNQKQAEDQAFLDFQEVAEETQQSSRPDLISNQQAGPLGRLILAWGNTPMQMTRIQKKKLSDLINRRRIAGYTQAQSDMANISGIMYYGVIQNLWFGALQSGLMFMLFGWNDDDEKQEKLELRVANGALDTLLRGTGIYGAGVSTLKNVLLKWQEERKKGWNRENLNIAQEAIGLSPPMGTKMRKIMNAIKTEQYNKGVSKEIGFRIENPNLSIAANWTEALLNIPVARVLNKANNLEEAITGNHELWQRVALVSGWSRWSIGVEDEELEEAKTKAKETRAQEKEKTKEQDKKEKEKKEQEEKKKKGIKTVRCSGMKSNGKRCSLTTETNKKKWKCMHHMTFKDGMDRDGDGKKEYRCTAITSSGKRCGNKGEYGKKKRCYAHQ